MLEMCADHSLEQVVRKPTHDQNILDLFLTNHPTLVTNSDILPRLSDHDIPVVDTLLKAIHTKQKPRSVHQYKKADWDSFHDYMAKTRDTFLNTNHQGKTTQEIWDCIKGAIQTGMKKFIPKRP